MIACIIILCVVTLVFALLMVRSHIIVEYRESLTVRVTVLGFELFRHPKRKKKIRVSDYSPKKLARQRRKNNAKQARKKKRTQKKNKRQQNDTTTPTEKKGLLGNLDIIRELLTVVFLRFSHHVKLRATRIIIKVASDDAAKTAIAFGAINQAVAAILELLDSAGKWYKLQSARVLVAPDFTAERTTADIHIALSLRGWHLLDILLRAAWRFVKRKK